MTMEAFIDFAGKIIVVVLVVILLAVALGGRK